MSALWTAADAARATDGEALGDWVATGVSIDTRTLQPGDLFVALKDVRDGHDFVADALSKGAAAAMVSHRPDGIAEGAPLLMVGDVLDGLAALGRAGRARAEARVIAITGSVGKTSTKEMLRDILAGQGQTHAAEASYNNHWGVPLTLARLPQEAQFAIIEIGMNHPGEIAPLAEMTAPHVALITTVAAAHLEAFDDIDGIAHEKASIFQGLGADGLAIYNAEVATAPILADAASRTGTPLSFGTDAGCDYRIDDVRLAEGVTVVQATCRGAKVLFKVSAPGRHFAMNALGALAAAQGVGADLGLAAFDLAAWRPPAGRGTRETVALDAVEDHLTLDLIDDAFNANPASMAASLDVLEATHPTDDIGRIDRGRRIAVLGDMLELGPNEARLHADIADHPGMEAVALVHCVGPRMTALWNALPEFKRGERVDTAEELAARAHHLFDAGDVVLVKGSKGSRVSLVVDAIRKLGAACPTTVGS